MENLRWILIFAGVAILVLLYVSGRSSGATGRRRRARTEPDPLLGQDAPRARSRTVAPTDHELDLDAFDVDPADLERPGAAVRPAVRTTRRVPMRRRTPVHDFETVSEADFEPVGYADEAPPAPVARRGDHRADPRRAGPGDGRGRDSRDHGHDDYGHDGYGHDGHGHAGYEGAGHARPPAPEWAVDHGQDDYPDLAGGGRSGAADPTHAGGDAGGQGGESGDGGASSALGGIGRRIGSIGARLGAGRRDDGDEAPSESADAPAREAPTKVVTLHVVSPDGAWFDGASIADTFESRGYAFGEMDIFHSMHRGRIVFSIAKMVEPGRFDPDDIESFATPGLVMILQLPGPVAADAAFEVLLAEAHELAGTLDARVLDGERSTLSRQSAQHMRDGIREFMHRRKYHDAGAG